MPKDVAVAVRADDDKVMGLVKSVTEYKMDIRRLQVDVAQTECKIVQQLIRERRTDCLSINYGALRRFYHD